MLVAQSGPSHQAENPLTPFPAPPLAAAIGGALFRAQPPASRPPKGDWPVEADLARLTLPGQPSISGSDHRRHQKVGTMRILGFGLRGLAMTLSGGAMVVVVCCESATHRLTLLPGHLLDKGWPPVGGSLLGQIRGNIGIMRPPPQAPPAITPPVSLLLRSGWQKGQTTAGTKERELSSLSRPKYLTWKEG